MKNETKLKPCPFCGSDEAEVCEGSPYASDPDRATYRVVCGFCGANPAGTWTVTEAKAMWNRRLAPLEALAHRDAVREARERLEECATFAEGQEAAGIMAPTNDLRIILDYIKEQNDEAI